MHTTHGTCGSVAGIDTRLISAVQTRAGARVHEAAGLLNGYYLWARLLARAERLHDRRMIETALPQVRNAKVRLRRFLTCAQPAFA